MELVSVQRAVSIVPLQLEISKRVFPSADQRNLGLHFDSS
jgi:hypothetical protein